MLAEPLFGRSDSNNQYEYDQRSYDCDSEDETTIHTVSLDTRTKKKNFFLTLLSAFSSFLGCKFYLYIFSTKKCFIYIHVLMQKFTFFVNTSVKFVSFTFDLLLRINN